MRQYVVPQFIDVEGKIIGPITTRQFVLLLTGGFVTFLAFKFLHFMSFIGVTVTAFILVVVFGFVKVQGRPFHLFLKNIINTIFTSSMLKVWIREVDANSIKNQSKKTTSSNHHPGAILNKGETKISSHTRLSELSLIVDTGGAYSQEKENYG